MENTNLNLLNELGVKCGELFIKNKSFNYCCFFCHNISVNKTEFLNHLNEKHELLNLCKDNFENTRNKDFKDLLPTSDPSEVSKCSKENLYLANTEECNHIISDCDSQSPENSNQLINSHNEQNEIGIEKNVKQNEVFIQKSLREISKPEKGSKQLKQLPCPHCERVYQRPKLLKAHIETHTPGFLTCNICQKTYTTKQNLQNHIKLHNGHVIKCSICKKSFSKQGNLKLHLKIHDGVKPYACKYQNCNYKAINPVSLRKHEKCHTDLRTEICEICGQTFKDKGGLREHQKRHNNQRDFQCTVCDKKFYNKKSLKEHENIHTGFKNFVCQVCPVQFSNKRNLRAHMKKHSGVKSFICKYCNEAFYLYSERQYHIKSRHRDISNWKLI